MTGSAATAAGVLALLAAAPAPAPGAAEIHDLVLKLYAGASTYQDEGTITYVQSDGHTPARTRKGRFQTAFTRAGGFRFEVQLEAGAGVGAVRDIVWRDGAEMRRQASDRKHDSVLRDLRSLVQAAGLASGLPTGFHPLALLLPDVDYPGKSRKPFSRIADGRHEGRDCYRLQVRDTSMGEFQRTLWIDKASSQLVRLDEVSSIDMVHGPELSTEFHVIYRPTFDKPVPAKALAIDR
jgi:hypothetical protein